MDYLFHLFYAAHGSGSLQVSVIMVMVYEEAEAWTKSGLWKGGTFPPPRSHHHVQMSQIQPGLQVKVLGAIAGGTNPRLWVSRWVRSRKRCWAQRWPCLMTGRHRLLRDGDHHSWSPAALRGLGAEVGSRTFPTGSSLRSPLLDHN